MHYQCQTRLNKSFSEGAEPTQVTQRTLLLYLEPVCPNSAEVICLCSQRKRSVCTFMPLKSVTLPTVESELAPRTWPS